VFHVSLLDALPIAAHWWVILIRFNDKRAQNHDLPTQHDTYIMKLWSQSMTGALKMIGIFSLLALLTPVFAQEAADAVAAVAEAATEVAEAAAEEAPAYADYDAFAASPGFALFTVNNLWLLISAALVFIMHLGFSTVESGLCQSKNTVNILFK